MITNYKNIVHVYRVTHCNCPRED